MPIMIPFNQYDPQPSMPRTPALQRVQRLSGVRLARVQQIAKKHEHRRLELADQKIEPPQIVRSRANWHGNAARAKHCVLAEMRIGDEQTPQRGIKNRT
ncbi:hypothetical protein GGD40_005107 [Paraburkholderia bryophila]|uniref:Uncharacterized protein n=1 Tax=Paraburkholderia bryophila TaxID=420952 RepID=A0A7Z0B8G4_9BURK|nr:hypothetical protein [Paraburkholderia bryophila]